MLSCETGASGLPQLLARIRVSADCFRDQIRLHHAHRTLLTLQGFGTNEKILIDVLSSLDPFQVDVLARTYEQMNGRSLQKTLEKELSSW